MRIIGDGGHAKVVREVISAMREAPGDCFVAVGDNRARKREAEAQRDASFAILIHPTAHVSASAVIGPGSVIMAHAVVQPAARIGAHCIVNTGATVDHDCILGDYVHVAPGAHLCGGVQVGEGTLVGVGVGIAPLARIPAWSVVKAARLDIVPNDAA